MADLNGTWSWRSFRSDAATQKIAVKWAPPGELVATTDAAGQVTGTLTFRPGVALTVTGSIIPADGEQLEGIEVTGEGLSAVYNIRGFFIDADHLVGTVVGVKNDLAGQPDGTSGPFALFKINQ